MNQGCGDVPLERRNPRTSGRGGGQCLEKCHLLSQRHCFTCGVTESESLGELQHSVTEALLAAVGDPQDVIQAEGINQYRPGDIFTKALDLRQDGFGGSPPHEGMGLGVVLLHKGIDFADEVSHLGEGTASDNLLGHDAKPAFHFIDP